tara:strand:- start:52947 stop:53090 length:144 start_codon:yes stop_codon:yes gene_type:complete
MSKRIKRYRDADWAEPKVEDKQLDKEKKSRRSEDRKRKLSDKKQFIS